MINSDFLFPLLIGDVGGTNARFQIVPDPQSPVVGFDNVKTGDFDTIETAIETAVLSQSDLVPATAIIAAAGPITKDGLNLTNSHWVIDPHTVLQSGLVSDLILLNDFEAQALSLPSLGTDDLCGIGNAASQQRPERTKVVLGPGTGLGVGLLVRAGGQWVPVAGEGGHVDLGPRTAREVVIWRHLDKADGRISAEQVVCGDGLLNLYRAICKADGVEPVLSDPAYISGAAITGGNEQADESLDLFCTCLGRVAGDLALIAMARGGVYIAGGIARQILPILQAGGFRLAFDDKAPHSDLMRQMETHVVTHPMPALLGLVAFGREPSAFAVDIDHRRWKR